MTGPDGVKLVLYKEPKGSGTLQITFKTVDPNPNPLALITALNLDDKIVGDGLEIPLVTTAGGFTANPQVWQLTDHEEIGDNPRTSIHTVIVKIPNEGSPMAKATIGVVAKDDDNPYLTTNWQE